MNQKPLRGQALCLSGGSLDGEAHPGTLAEVKGEWGW